MRLIISVDEKTINQCTESVRSGINTYEQYIIACGVPYTEVRPQGEWIKEEDGVHSKCSLCGFKYADYGILFDFCPNCGADMKGCRE